MMDQGGEDDEKTYCKFSVGSFHGGQPYSLRGGAAKTENKETEAAADTTAAKAEETEAAADGKTHLKWAMWDKDLTVYYKALVEAIGKGAPGCDGRTGRSGKL